MRPTTAFVPVAALVLMVAEMMTGTAAGQTVPAGSPSVVEGTISMLVEDDFLHGHANTYYFLDEPARHGRYDLKLTPRQVKRVQPGMRVRVMGSLAGRVLTADADQHGVAVLEAPLAAAPVAALRVLVLLVDITDSNLVTHAISSTCDDSSAMAAAKTFVTSPDLVTTIVGNPPTTAARGGTFKTTDTVKNQGLVTAGASTTRYYLSLDRQRDGNDVLLGGSRSVSSLAPGKTSSGNATVTISTATPPGTYYLLACADDLGTVGELDDTNNCLASTTTVVVP